MATITLQDAQAALKALRDTDTTGWTSEQHRRHTDAMAHAANVLSVISRTRPAFAFPKLEKATQADLFGG
jgi:hypothetical protein